MLEDLLPDLIEVVEHIAYSHSFRTEDAQKRVSGLLSGIRTRLVDLVEPKPASTPAPEPVISQPAPAAPVMTAEMQAAVDAEVQRRLAAAGAGPAAPDPTPVPPATSAPSAAGSPVSAPDAVSGETSAVAPDAPEPTSAA